jgi:hypothetical protein
MRLSLVLISVLALSFCMPACLQAYGNEDAKWGFHFAGEHDPQSRGCSFILTDCSDFSLVTEAPGGSGRYDIYVIALDVAAIAGTRYGMCCDGSFYFYGWTPCSDLELPTAGWPDCGEGIVQAWSAERFGPHVTIGVLDVYAYSTSNQLGACVDPRTGLGEWCDASSPAPVCDQTDDPSHFGSVGFGTKGYNPCGSGSGEATSWGRLKTVYRQ